MSFSNPRRTPMARDSDANGLKLKTTNLTLRKGATFHSPTTPPSSPPAATTFKVPSLPRRSQTNLDDVVDAHRRRAALTIGQFEDSLTVSKPESSSSRRSFRDNSLPVPRGFLDHALVGDTMSQSSNETVTERRVLRPRPRRSSRNHESDSGLGSSIASASEKRKEGAQPNASAITRSVAASKSEGIPRLSVRAVNRIHEHTLKPLLAKRSLKDFRPIVLDCPRRIQENQIICLRDLEKTLIFMAPERAKSADLYLDFCLTSIRCIQATVEYLSDRDQTRPHDRPYSNGYFIDLVEQIHQHAQQMQESRERQAAGEALGDMDVDPSDEIKLMGGLTTNGRPAELVRVKKNGKTISVATGQPIDDLEEESKGAVRFKRSMSQQLEDEEEIMRSMARRKKNASPEELAPKKCKEPGCNKEFKRPCDLTKHEKTHSRPWKCPLPTCKYHEFGWPTEKEMDRHVNDKHSAAPPMYECKFKPCPYKSKRESNCKQHMEKAHGWTYVRTKTNGKKSSSNADSEAKPTPQLNNLPTPSSDHSNSVMTPPEDIMFRSDYPLEFPAYPSTDEFNQSLFSHQHFQDELRLDFSAEELTPPELSPVDNSTPSTDAGQFSAYQDLSPEFTGQFEDIYGAPVQVPNHSIFGKDVPNVFTSSDVCPPVSAPHFSPAGQGNTMLYTPQSMVDMDEGFEDFPATANQFGDDFLLFDPVTERKHADMFEVTPSFAAGFTQPSSQDFNIEYNQSMDWTSADFQAFPN